MVKYRLILFLFIALSVSCTKKTPTNMTAHKYTNALIKETSPYLLQHAHNPVNWYPWNDTTLELAKKENKLILVSAGYAACHWCHVMEHESFEDEEVAEIMNKNFINIKVDREERPDVDQVYMSAVQLMTGRGGWPLNCVALPDGRPIWGGTYFPKDNWISILKQLADLYTNEPEKAEEYASKLTEGIKQTDAIIVNSTSKEFTLTELNTTVNNWKKRMDFQYGGSMGAPKFPIPNNFIFLLRYAVQTNNQDILNYVNTSLTKIALGGINDQVGGGFARYSVDNRWHIPHFEKMLYDNAQLVSLYAQAYMATENSFYKDIVYETTAFVERELMDKNGAFYSSLDADSKNTENELEEGAFYVWKKEELQHIIKDDFELFTDYYNINASFIWEEKYNLHRTITDEEFCKKHFIEIDQLKQKVKSWKQLLFEQRNKKERPRLDDKVLTSWNALMLKGYVDVYKAFGDHHFLTIALKNANFISKVQQNEEGGLFRNFKNGKSTINAYLEDYATVIDAYISLYQVTLDENWLQQANQLAMYTFDHFFDTNSKMFFFTSDLDRELVSRKIETDDNVIPSSNSIMANNLFKLSYYFNNKSYKDTSVQMLHNIKNIMLNYGAGASNWACLYSNLLGDYYEVAIVGDNALEATKEINKQYVPNKLIVGSTGKSNLPLLQNKYTPNSTTIYVCVDGACLLPVNETKKALEQLKISIQ
ncbi:MAG: thioredoxin domain-containing protein [Flavobacteriaceae bacterium]|nr:thioredoxin domain-containing protein [Flavobacteriaceae bacterium]